MVKVVRHVLGKILFQFMPSQNMKAIFYYFLLLLFDFLLSIIQFQFMPSQNMVNIFFYYLYNIQKNGNKSSVDV